MREDTSDSIANMEPEQSKLVSTEGTVKRRLSADVDGGAAQSDDTVLNIE